MECVYASGMLHLDFEVFKLNLKKSMGGGDVSSRIYEICRIDWLIICK
jgi:hypothetical protein